MVIGNCTAGIAGCEISVMVNTCVPAVYKWNAYDPLPAVNAIVTGNGANGSPAQLTLKLSVQVGNALPKASWMLIVQILLSPAFMVELLTLATSLLAVACDTLTHCEHEAVTPGVRSVAVMVGLPDVIKVRMNVLPPLLLR